MATIATLVSRIEARLALAYGVDVQVLEEPRLLEMLRHKYNTLFDERWWLDQMTLEQFTTNGTTGVITGTVEDKIRRLDDIHSIFWGNDTRPLPWLTPGENPLNRTAKCVAPFTSTASKMFKIHPIDTVGTINVWYRTRLSDAQWEEEDNDTTEVPFDDEVLILGVVYDYLIDDGSNDESAKKYGSLYDKRFNQLVQNTFQFGIRKTDDQTGVPSEWMQNGG